MTASPVQASANQELRGFEGAGTVDFLPPAIRFVPVHETTKAIIIEFHLMGTFEEMIADVEYRLTLNEAF